MIIFSGQCYHRQMRPLGKAWGSLTNDEGESIDCSQNEDSLTINAQQSLHHSIRLVEIPRVTGTPRGIKLSVEPVRGSPVVPETYGCRSVRISE